MERTGQLADLWDDRRSAHINLERYLERAVLSQVPTHLDWIVDESEALSLTPFGSEVWGLFRSWRNRRSLAASGPWSRMTLILFYSVEADFGTE